MTFVLIPAQSFLMGSEDGRPDESPVHRVLIDAFELGACQVTNSEYAAFANATGHAPPPAPFSDPEQPVVGVSWREAVAYCDWLSSVSGARVRLPFEAEWDQMLDRHGIAAPLHMKEFGPHGRFANIGKVCRHELIAEAAQLIITHRIFSIGATISNEEYKACVDKRLRERWSLYGMCFMLAATINHNLAEQNDYKEKIPFMLDNGNPHRPHIHQAYDQLIDLQKTGVSFNAGTLTFGDDADFGVLQAADLIAWGVRRRLSGNPFLKWFEPITEILDEAKGHAQQQWKEHWLKVFSNHLQEVESELLNPPNSP